MALRPPFEIMKEAGHIVLRSDQRSFVIPIQNIAAILWEGTTATVFSFDGEEHFVAEAKCLYPIRSDLRSLGFTVVRIESPEHVLGFRPASGFSLEKLEGQGILSFSVHRGQGDPSCPVRIGLSPRTAEALFEECLNPSPD